jgi:glycosyltransferase involved in cell wall biosynthesis
MTIGIDFVGTNFASGTKTYNINFCNELNTLKFQKDIKIFICKNYFAQIHNKLNKNNKIEYILKPNFLSITFFRIIWMQFIFPLELKLLGIKKLYSPMNFSPILAKFLNIKVALCLHSNLPWVYFNLMPGNIIRNFITKKLMEKSIYICDILIVNSYFAKEEIMKSLNLHKKKIEVIYLGINRNLLSKKRKKDFENNFDYKNKYILSVISCVKYHNIINILTAYKKLIEEINFSLKFVLVMQVLDKEYYNEVKNFIINNFKANTVIILFNLKIKEISFLYKKASAYIFSSYCEVFGFTTIEAMLFKIPVVVSNRSALAEVNSNAALYFDPDKITQIKNSLKKILLNKIVRKKLVMKGTQNLKRFSLNESVKKTLKIIDQLS